MFPNALPSVPEQWFHCKESISLLPTDGQRTPYIPTG